MYTPKEVAENYLSACRAKAVLPLGRMFLLACMAGAFVALAGTASTAAAATVGDPSLAKLVSGCVFPAGLAMVIVAGSELFTGNNLMIMGVLSRVICARQMLRNWCVVYLGNFVGAALVAALCVLGHVFSAFVIGVTVIPINPIISVVCIICGVFIAITRVALGVHFIRDVIAGALIGIICGIIVLFI